MENNSDTEIQVNEANPVYFYKETLKASLPVQWDLLSKTNFILPYKSESLH